MPRAFGLGAILVGFWLVLSGHFTFEHGLVAAFGAASVVLVVYIAARMDVVDHEGLPLHLGGRFWMYVPWLMKEILVSNIQVAKIVLDPKLPIDPVMAHFTGSQQTDVGRAIYANSVTLTPGTITTGVHGNDYEIHALHSSYVDGSEENEMDRRVTWVERGS